MLFEELLPGKRGKHSENLITPFVYSAAYLLKDATQEVFTEHVRGKIERVLMDGTFVSF